MTIFVKIKNIAQDVRRRAQRIGGRAKQAVGRTTGNDKLRREGKADVLKSRLNQFAKKIKDAIKR